ncbi:hypothetical protein RR48_01916 [Papilio machaon]|uniref:Uncharacterized protein n=1 Tax=Papilio machaon TaxID=76193 RepID=A0A0N1IFL1_PAPMA|nr:hypothetical protein RR48_01916 [Papilio machaon]
MSRMNRLGKKNALQQRKEKLLEELKLCDKQIKKAKQNETNNNLKYDDSSDSDTELTLRMDKSKSLPSLVRKKSALQTRCNATAELTGLEVLESTVNILTESPEINGEPQITEEGVWHEVIAECKVDLIPFTISFYVHQPVLKSYAASHRSRRTTLARLAEMYGDDLFMTPLSEGGYQLQCANVLELSWTLESKPSTVAYFRHRMKLSLEYMDEPSLKIITQANKEMSNPSVDTEERTSLLSKIISTCLKAQGDGSESEASRVQKRPNDAMDIPVAKKKKENEVMGPPKALPKKTKVKGKENDEIRLNSNKEINKPKKSVSEEIKANEGKESNKNANLQEKAKNNVKVKDGKNIKNPTKDSNKESNKKTNDSNSHNKMNKNSLKPDLSVKNTKTNKAQETNKMNAPNKENIVKSKDKENNDKINEKGKKVPNKKENVASTKIKENKNTQDNKQNFTNSNEKIFPQKKRINLIPNLKTKNHPNTKTGNIGTYDSKIKPINKRFSGNINKGKINLQKTKIPMKINEKNNPFRMSPRTNEKNLTSTSINSIQKGIGVKTSNNIARLVKRQSGNKQ